jgi:hypothetical protein
MEGILYGQAVELIFKMFFFTIIIVLGVAITALIIGLIVLGFVWAGKYLLVHISEVANEPKEKILARKIKLPVAQMGVTK